MRYRNIWVEAEVCGIAQVAENVMEIKLQPQVGTVPFSVGSHIDVMVPINEVMEVRSYSLVGEYTPNTPYTIAVKKLPSSRGGSSYMWMLEQGNRIKISHPTNNFELAYNSKNYLLVAGGIGITPLVGIAEVLAKDPSNKVQMFYIGKNETDMPYLERLKNCLDSRLTIHFSESMGTCDTQEIIKLAGEDTLLYLCGPLPLMNAVRKNWEQSEWPNTHIRFETFGASGKMAPQAFKVIIPRYNLEILVDENDTLFNALEHVGIPMMSDCLKGECGLCMVDILEHSGIIDHRDFFLSDDQKEENHKFCSCVSRVANGAITIEVPYQGETISK
ncbi:PDR/VanB family oxidoreductase [Allomuricauda sp. NBRC 101325]|uniref:PDR/VanB family oxidoreductase n=1 Tax=Allomuricauda sp. NBRC 101325 TaxID=1113758 RepID=UPI0024A1C147|nr:PDR/VanB family oxidoreductase [Muricauda sp. NBRC 101325]GLU43949.1 diguanylate cyclase [Muricauda sp. NBRC 101325]